MILRGATAAALAAACGFFGLLLAAAWVGVPLPAGDQDYFLPVAAEIAATGEFRHPFFSPVPDNPGNLFHWHGWLMPRLHAALMPPGGYERVLVPGVALAALATLAGFLAIRARDPWLALLALPVLACLASYQTGRPELPAGPLLVALTLLPPARAGWSDAAAAALIGLVAVTSPVLGPAAGLVHALRLMLAGGALRAGLVRLAASGLGAMAIAAALTLSLTPLPLSEWLRGLAAHAALIAARSDSGALLHYTLLQPRMPLLALPLLLLPALILLRLRREGGGAWLLPGLMLLGWLWWFGARIPPTIYNAAALIPVALLLWAERRFAPALGRLLLVPAAVASVTALWDQGATATGGLRDGVRAEQLRSALRALPHDAVAGTGDVALAMVAREVLGADRVRHGPAAEAAGWRIVRQAYSGLAEPERMPDRCLVAETFERDKARIARSKDWAFALWGPCAGG